MRNWLIGGGVLVGGFLLYRWWQARPITNAAQTAGGTPAGNAASSMNTDAARSTVFGAGILVKNLLGTVGRTLTQVQSATSPARQPESDAIAKQAVYNAILAPQPVAPSPSATRVNQVGTVQPMGTQPPGDPPSPGSPAPTFFNLRGIHL